MGGGGWEKGGGGESDERQVAEGEWWKVRGGRG